MKNKNIYTCIHIMFVTFVIIFKFILISLLHVLLVFKIKGNFGKKIPTQKCVERGSFLYIYSIDKNQNNDMIYTTCK